MKKHLLLLIIALVTLPHLKAHLLSKTKRHPLYTQLKTGDIVFQDTGGFQGAAVTKATGSNYTHCGVVFEQDGKLFVFEALQPVKVTPLKKWKKRSRIFHAMRLKDHKKLTPKAFEKGLEWGRKQLGKKYDFKFQWDNDRLYCSELVWKIYKKATGVELSKHKTFQDYQLDHPIVKTLIRTRYGNRKNLPKNARVVAPSDLAQSKLLIEVPKLAKKSGKTRS